MTELELLEVIGCAQTVHILDAGEMPATKKKRFSHAMVRSLAAVFALVLTAILLLRTPVGVAAMEVVKEQFTRILDILFPPKQTVMYIEGEPVPVHVEAQGREPETNTPGFSIYVDTQTYTMTEENGAWFIRPIHTPVNSAELPPLEMEIREIPDKSPLEAAEMVRSRMEGKWENLSDIGSYGQPVTLCIDASDTYGADAPWQRHDFKNNAQDGCFHIITRGYMEAAEGHGVRFSQMLKTFTLVAPQDTSQYTDEADALGKAMEQEVANAREQDRQYEIAIQNAANQAEMNIASTERSALWQDVHNKLWTALEQRMDEESFLDLMAEELNWAARKGLALDNIREELDGGTLTATALGGENTQRTRERVETLLQYLQGTAGPARREASVECSPKPVADAFTDAYFRKDTQEVKQYLSESFSGDMGIHATGTEVIHAIKGLDNVMADMTALGHLNTSVEFRATPDSDSYTYLSITLIWEDDHWAVASFGLEG